MRDSHLYRAFRRTSFFMSVLRPVHDFRLTRKWWADGRPAPPPHAIKMADLLHAADSIAAVNFVETGAYLGDTIRHMRGRFKHIFSIEIASVFAVPLQNEFAADGSIEIVLGDSGVELPKVVGKLVGPTLFWLDAHYSGGQTEGDGHVPIYDEISAIAKLCKFDHVIAIDDMKDFNGKDGYPTVPALHAYMEKLGYDLSNFNNIMHARMKRHT
jgi:hypothetical protein